MAHSPQLKVDSMAKNKKLEVLRLRNSNDSLVNGKPCTPDFSSTEFGIIRNAAGIYNFELSLGKIAYHDC